MTDPAINELLVKQRLSEMEMAYCRALDRRDEVLLRSLFFDDARVEHGRMYAGSAAGFAAWAVNEFLPRYQATAHYILNQWYRVAGDRAEGEVYRVTYHLERGDPASLATIAAGRAFNIYERREGVWKIAARTVARDWIEQHAVAGSGETMAFGMDRSMPDASDRSYSFLSLFPRGGFDGGDDRMAHPRALL